MKYLLVEKLATDRLGKTVWYRRWTGIGPECTSVREEAEEFDSRLDAVVSNAFRHPLSFFDVVEADPS